VRTDKAGQIIGVALEDYNGELQMVGKIMVLVETGYSTGARLKSVMARRGVDLDAIPEDVDIDKVILAQMIQDKQNITQQTDISEILSDRIVAGLEVIAPRVVTDTLVVNNLVPVDKQITLTLGDGGQFMVTNSASASPHSLFTLDNAGNAFFAGNIEANHISGIIDGLDSITAQLASLSGKGEIALPPELANVPLHLAELASRSAQLNSFELDTRAMLADNMVSLGASIASLSTKFDALSSQADTLLSVFASLGDQMTLRWDDIQKSSQSLTFTGPVTLAGGLVVTDVGALGSAVNLLSDTFYFGRPYFNTDTGGFAIVSAGQTEVPIVFDRDYLYQPVVHATIDLGVASSSDVLEQHILDQGVQYMVTRAGVHGFTIRLSKQATTDIPFSWTAFAITEPKTFTLIPTPTPTPYPTPTPSETSTPGETPSPSITDEPAASPSEIPTDTPVLEVSPVGDQGTEDGQ
jgi:hypothetical protein